MSIERTGVVALVAGASRGVGRGIASALSQRPGWIVYATGRTILSEDVKLPPGVRRLACDHTDDDQVRRAIERVQGEEQRLDVLVNSVWGGYEGTETEEGGKTWTAKFWEQPLERWDKMFVAGVRSAFVTSALAAPLMMATREHEGSSGSAGLIANISYWAAQHYVANAIYGASKAATDKLTRDMAHELATHRIAVVSLYPGIVRTELVCALAEKGFFDLSNSESPEFCGLVIAALQEMPAAELMKKSGGAHGVAALAQEAGVADIDGTQPAPFAPDDAPTLAM